MQLLKLRNEPSASTLTHPYLNDYKQSQLYRNFNL